MLRRCESGLDRSLIVEAKVDFVFVFLNLATLCETWSLPFSVLSTPSWFKSRTIVISSELTLAQARNNEYQSLLQHYKALAPTAGGT
jgi:hypothetical protein